MERYVCIHGHFYQPPRENPWLEEIELQDSAYPYHDWNERITAECYAANAASRMLDCNGRITKIINNYSSISFNFGPTLLSWLCEKHPQTYKSILDGDQKSRKRFSGHGSAMAQGYNHVILPLANRRDKHTQVLWGIRDFQHRFGRAPEGFWLPETAADLETLDVLAKLGVRFTVLSPYQAARTRRMNDRHWVDASQGRIDPSTAYELRLPSGRKISVFFYDGPVSSAVAFERLLDSGKRLADRLLSAFNDSRPWPQLVHIATDGETYGHHHRYGDMALAAALHHLESGGLATLTNYGEHLDRCPPSMVVDIFENRSWSCAHGVERWRSNCGCSSGSHPGWNQNWRTLLREAFDWLRDTLAQLFERCTGTGFKDPWLARDDYIELVLDRSPDRVSEFFSRHTTRELGREARLKMLQALEMQRHAMLMYTSCGWFFDELSGVEPVQVIQYAARAVQLAREAFGQDIEEQFLLRLESAKSNLPEHSDGRVIYEKFVRPAIIDLNKVAAHHVIGSIFRDDPAVVRISAYEAFYENSLRLQAGSTRLHLGRVRITSRVVGSCSSFGFCVLQFGRQNISCGLRADLDQKSYIEYAREISEVFQRADYAQLIRVMDRLFGEHAYSLQSLFRDEQRRIVGLILDATLSDLENAYRQVIENHAALIRLLNYLGQPIPQPLVETASLVLNRQLRTALLSEQPDREYIGWIVEEARVWQVHLDSVGIAYSLEQDLQNKAKSLAEKPCETQLLGQLQMRLDLVRTLPFGVNLWGIQNVYYAILKGAYPQMLARAAESDLLAQDWLNRFLQIGQDLEVNVGELKEEISQALSVPSVPRIAEEIVKQRHTPRTTYRLQLNADVTFRKASALLPYFRLLGISDLYLSPIFEARPRSTHGYDICDYNKINPELGDENDLANLRAEASNHGITLVLDVVPNHMGLGSSNVWWMDILENGPSSTYAGFFDIDWDPVKPELKDRVLLPILEDQYGRVLESGKLRLAFESGAFFIYYEQTKLPVAPRTYGRILSKALDIISEQLGQDDPYLQELQSILTALSYLPPRTEQDSKRIAERNREKEIIKRRMAVLSNSSPAVGAAIDAAVQQFNGITGDSHSFDALDALLSEQAYQPAYWRVAAEEINYRRFFDINDLAAIRMESPEVFEATHRLLFRLLQEGQISGLRIDHADGLLDPEGYLRQIQFRYLSRAVEKRMSGSGVNGERIQEALQSWFSNHFDGTERTLEWPLWVVVEKILSPGEPLPQNWAISGTTGYDFLNTANGLFVDSGNEAKFTDLYAQFTGLKLDYNTVVNSSKKMIMLISLAGEVYALSHHLERIAKKNRWYRDFTLNSLTFAIREIIAALKIYRTYVGGLGAVPTRDRAYIEAACAEAKKRNPRTAAALFDFVKDTLLLQNLQDFRKPEQAELLEWVLKFQQITGPVMAKGVEDSAFYIFNRLVSLNEVGGTSEPFGTSISAFHRQNTERVRNWPHSMLASSTHDTKRGEDLRARINVLSEMPEDWMQAIDRWSQINDRHKCFVDGDPVPDRNEEYLLYQTLVGAWPLEGDEQGRLSEEDVCSSRKRIVQYMEKAINEAKVHTSWINLNQKYNEAVREFVERVLTPEKSAEFTKDFLSFQSRIAFYGALNSLSQVVLKLTSPGIPDIYQGSELWDFRLVDPDNRLPVDFGARASLLNELTARIGQPTLSGFIAELLKCWKDGRIKLYVIKQILDVRKNTSDLFTKGEYLVLEGAGEKESHLCAFARSFEEHALLVAVPRLVVGLTKGRLCHPLGPEVWGTTTLSLPDRLSGRSFRNLFTGEEIVTGKSVNLSNLFAGFPVAVLQDCSSGA